MSHIKKCFICGERLQNDWQFDACKPCIQAFLILKKQMKQMDQNHIAVGFDRVFTRIGQIKNDKKKMDAFVFPSIITAQNRAKLEKIVQNIKKNIEKKHPDYFDRLGGGISEKSGTSGQMYLLPPLSHGPQASGGGGRAHQPSISGDRSSVYDHWLIRPFVYVPPPPPPQIPQTFFRKSKKSTTTARTSGNKSSHALDMLSSTASERPYLSQSAQQASRRALRAIKTGQPTMPHRSHQQRLAAQGLHGLYDSISSQATGGGGPRTASTYDQAFKHVGRRSSQAMGGGGASSSSQAMGGGGASISRKCRLCKKTDITWDLDACPQCIYILDNWITESGLTIDQFIPLINSNPHEFLAILSDKLQKKIQQKGLKQYTRKLLLDRNYYAKVKTNIGAILDAIDRIRTCVFCANPITVPGWGYIACPKCMYIFMHMIDTYVAPDGISRDILPELRANFGGFLTRFEELYKQLDFTDVQYQELMQLLLDPRGQEFRSKLRPILQQIKHRLAR